jgi:cyclic nucleotide gated channel
MKWIDSGGHEKHGSDTSWDSWKENANASACFTLDGFSYGIYAHAVNLTGENTIIRYTYSLVWGIQVWNQWHLLYTVLSFSSIYY